MSDRLKTAWTTAARGARTTSRWLAPRVRVAWTASVAGTARGLELLAKGLRRLA